MALLENTLGSLRFELMLADIEMPLKGRPPASRKLLARVAVESFDQKEGAWAPFVRLPVWWLGVGEGRELLGSLEAVIRGDGERFAFRSKASGEIGLQVEREASGYRVEVGFDLRTELADLSGKRGATGEDLALFRFRTGQAQLVRFASDLKEELSQLSER